MLGKWFKIRILQSFRFLKEIGIIRTLFLVFVVLPFAVIFIYEKSGNNPYGYLFSVILGSFFFMLHRRRRDYSFLCGLISHPAWFYWVEYLIFSLWFAGILLYKGDYGAVLLWMIILMLISLSRPRRFVLHAYTNIIRNVPSDLFEWRSGIRQNFWFLWIIPIFMLAGIFSYVSGVFAFFLFVMSVLDFYVECEPLNILGARHTESKNFIKQKLLRHIGFFAWILLPFLLVLLSHGLYWYYSIVAYFIALNLLVFVILLKYSFYSPGAYTIFLRYVFPVVCLISVLLPVGILVVFANVILYRKALKRLNIYLYAYY